MSDNRDSGKAVIVGLSYCFSKLFHPPLSFAFHLSPPDTVSSLYLLFGLFLSLHCNHLHRGACHLYLLISSNPSLLWALLHLNVRLMSLPHPPDTSAQRLLKAFMEQCEPGGWYKLKHPPTPLLSFFFIIALKGQLLAGPDKGKRWETGGIDCDWLPSSGFAKNVFLKGFTTLGDKERSDENSHRLKLLRCTVSKDIVHNLTTFHGYYSSR